MADSWVWCKPYFQRYIPSSVDYPDGRFPIHFELSISDKQLTIGFWRWCGSIVWRKWQWVHGR